MILEPVPPYVSPFHRVQLAHESWQLRGSYALRREVFCREQKIFTTDDRDSVDEDATTLVSLATNCGYPDEVVATVRIHRGAGPHEWWGSRLAVQRNYRGLAGLGAALVKGAVGTALHRGCWRFYAHVQAKNETFFSSLHWRVLDRIEHHGRPHVLMEAELRKYQPLELFKGYATTIMQRGAA